MKLNKASGVDKVNSHTLKLIANYIISPLTYRRPVRKLATFNIFSKTSTTQKTGFLKFCIES